MMQKPELKTISYIDYSEASFWISHLLGYNIDISYINFEENGPDFWGYLCDKCEIHNGGFICIDKYLLESSRDIIKTIVQKFIDEFGDVRYRTDW